MEETNVEQLALILYKNNIQPTNSSLKNLNCLNALILYKNNIQLEPLENEEVNLGVNPL